MRPATYFRSLSLFVLLGSIFALVYGTGALAMPQQPQMQTRSSENIPSDVSPDLSSQAYQDASSNTSALNWAGYVATGGTYTSVSGSWVVPNVTTGTSDNVADATWIGIGGVRSSDLIQAGTEAIPNSDGTISYQAWMELLPQDSRIVPLTITPGDSMSVSITETSSGVWDVSFDDATTGKMYSTTVQYNSSLSSADWVEEMPVEVGGVVALDNFGQVNFTNGYAIKNGQVVTIASSDATPLTMDNAAGEAVATPSVLGTDGASFSVARTDAASTPLALSSRGESVVEVGQVPQLYASSGGYNNSGSSYSNYGGYSARSHRGRGGYRISVQF